MSGITSKVRAAVAAIGMLACASPLAAQARHHQRGRALRYEAVWMERSQFAMRGPVRWQRDGYRVPVVVVARHPWAPRAAWRSPHLLVPRRVIVVAPRGRWIARPWRYAPARPWRYAPARLR